MLCLDLICLRLHRFSVWLTVAVGCGFDACVWLVGLCFLGLRFGFSCFVMRLLGFGLFDSVLQVLGLV